MPLYLEDDEDLYPRPDQEEDDDSSFDVGDPTKLPPAPAVGAIAPKPTPELQRLISGSPSPLPASDAPVNKGAEDARQKYVDVVSSRPNVPKPKWWQQALSGVAGGLAGWSNAAGRTRRPIDIQQLGQNINAPGYGRELANWQSKLQAADAAKTAAEENQTAWWKNRQMQTEEDRRAAEEERNRATAEWERERNDTLLQRSKIQDARDRDETLLKRPDAFTIQESERGSVPQGWQVTQSSQQGVLIATPPPFMKLPPELAPYSAGAKAGEIVPYSRYKAAQDAAAKDTIQQNKPVKPPAENIDRILLNSGEYTPEQVRKAQEMFDKVHRPPITSATIPGLNDAAGNGSKLTGDDFLSTLPAGTAAQVKAIAEGRSVLPPFGSRGVTALLRDAVFRYDPSFNEQRAQVRRAFTTGKQGDNIGSLNTATVHLDQFEEAARAMANGSFRPGNEIWNRLRTAFGSSAPTNLETLKAAVAGEMANALKGNATDVEIATMGRNLQSANSPQQLADAVQENIRILGGKLNTYRERYLQQAPDDTTWNPVMPSARAVFSKHSIDPTAGPQTNIGGAGGRGGRGGQQPQSTRPAIVQHSPSSGQYRYSLDGGQTWLPGQPPQ